MITLKQELDNYPFIDLKGLERNNPGIPDNIKNSITLYNKALESLRSSSEDIAIIELKKSIAMNPSFYEAMNLLGLCYMYVNEKEKAAEIFQKVIEAENNGIRATKYLNEISSNDEAKISEKEKKSLIKKRQAKPEGTAEQQQEAAPAKEKRGILKYLTGFLIGVIVVLSIFLPMTLSSRDNSANTSASEDITKLKNDLVQKNMEYDGLKEKYDNLQKDLETANQTADYYKYALKLHDVDDLAAAGKYTEAADNLLMLKTIEFKDAEKQKFSSLYASVMPKAAKASYDSGFALYSSKKYEEALKMFEKVPVYFENYEKMDGMLYYSGKCYQELKDSRRALSNFQKIIEKYPKGRYAQYAQYRINELTANP